MIEYLKERPTSQEAAKLGGLRVALPQGFESDPIWNQLVDVVSSLGLVADNTGKQAGARLGVIELLVHNRLVAWGDAKKLVTLLSGGSPEAQRRAIAQCVFQRKARPIPLSVAAIRRR